MNRLASRLSIAVAVTVSLVSCAATAPPTRNPDGILAANARAELKDGNARYLGGDVQLHDWLHERIHKTGHEGQVPSIGVLTCSDSRTPPELIFDQGIGTLFVVRNAGNSENDVTIGAFEYGVAALGVHTILVLGHTRCGAVTATATGQDLPGKMPEFVAAIAPALAGLPKGADGTVNPTDAEVANVRWQAAELVRRSDILGKAVAEKKLDILMGIYDVETGTVRFLD